VVIPPERKAAARYHPFYKQTLKMKKYLKIALLLFINVAYAQQTENKEISNSIKVEIKQLKKSQFGNCFSEIIIYNGSKIKDSLKFDNIESLGGNSGLYKYSEKINNNVIISKFGDYDGRTIIINQYGKIYNIIGGEIYFDKKNSFIISKYDSDLNGFSVFDIKNETLVMEMKDISIMPIDFYSDLNGRLFFTAKSDDSDTELIWEIEPEMERIMQVDIIKEELIKYKLLQLEIEGNKMINCE
jgi:hypothetical protein